jgi:hypothetical protein
VVEGDIRVTPGQVLYVVVGASGGHPAGGFNGGGRGGARYDLAAWGGGGSTDVRTIPAGQGAASLESRVVVAAGGGGTSVGGGPGAGEAGFAGPFCCSEFGDGSAAAQPGTQTGGGAGGACRDAGEGCGAAGGFGAGGDGGASGALGDPVVGVGGGGGGGWFGGGGGAGLWPINVGGGGGGSSKRPPGGSVGLADRSTPPQVQLTPVPPAPTACTDGTDNDVDGLVDYPADPGCVEGDDEDEWSPDTFPPDAGLAGERKQKLARTVVVEVSCLAVGEDCIVSATGTVTVGRGERAFQLKRARSVVVLRQKKATMRLAVPSRTRAAVAKALRARSRVSANVDVRVADETGNVRHMERRVRLMRAAR